MIDIQAELEKRYQESTQRATSLSERLNQLDQFNQTNPINMEGRPKGLNPMEGLNAWMGVQTGRNALSNDVQAQSDQGLNLLKELASYIKSNKGSGGSSSEDQGMAELLRTMIIGKQGWQPTEAKPTNTPTREDVSWRSPQGQWEWNGTTKDWAPTGGQRGQRYGQDISDLLTKHPEVSGKVFSSLDDLFPEPEKDETAEIYETYRKAGFDDKEIKDMIRMGIISLK